MRRPAVFAIVGAAALTLAGPAFAAYVPRLVVDPSSNAAGSSGPVTVSFSQTVADDPTARAEVYAPVGTSTILQPAPGAVLGTATATGKVGTINGIPLNMSGKLTADDPSLHVDDNCAAGAHKQVWLLELNGSGQSLTVPIYVDPVSNGFSSLRLVFCLVSPFVDNQVTLLRLDLHIGTGVLRSPDRTGDLVWRSFFTPYPGSVSEDDERTVESRALVRQPLQVSLLGKLVKSTTVQLFGTLTGGGNKLAGVAVALLAGSTARSQRVVSSTHTDRAGHYTFRLKLKKTTFFRTRISLPARDVTASECKAPSTAPAGCVSATVQPFHLLSGTAVKVSVKR